MVGRSNRCGGCAVPVATMRAMPPTVRRAGRRSSGLRELQAVTADQLADPRRLPLARARDRQLDRAVAPGGREPAVVGGAAAAVVVVAEAAVADADAAGAGGRAGGADGAPHRRVGARRVVVVAVDAAAGDLGAVARRIFGGDPDLEDGRRALADVLAVDVHRLAAGVLALVGLDEAVARPPAAGGAQHEVAGADAVRVGGLPVEQLEERRAGGQAVHAAPLDDRVADGAGERA